MDTSTMIFVFGSNEGGKHGGGAARFAQEQRGAVWGLGYGHVGQSFAIPTKDRDIADALPYPAIKEYVTGFLAYARGRPDLDFQITCIGCGLAGLDHAQIAPMFYAAPANCYFDTLWRDFLPGKSFWGTF